MITHCHCHEEQPKSAQKAIAYDLKVEYKINPLGMDESKPRFSYRLFGLQAQTARQIQVFKDGLKKPFWDTGWITDGHSIQLQYEGPALEPFTRYNWRIRVKDELGTISDWNSEKAFFETGFLGTPWEASKWLCASRGLRVAMYPQLFLREFTLPKGKKLRSARLCATALGCYEAEINGTVVSWPLAPGWTQYHSRVQYQVYDVTDLLNASGKNELWFTLAGGWYDGRIATQWNQGFCKYGNNEMFRAELRLTFSDGNTQIIGTNKDFTVFAHGGETRMSDIYDGEICEAWRTHEAVKAIGPAMTADTCEVDCDKPAIDITWTSGAEIKRLQTLQPQKITRRCQGTYIVDFGQNFTGREILHIKNASRGAVITVRHGEMLNPDGSLYTANLRSARAITSYIADDTKETTYEPRFTFFGFRYLEISGWIGRLTGKDVEAVVLSSDLNRTGNFYCDEPLLNQLFENVGWGLRSNLLDVPTDCPQRDERFGWTGDTQVICNTASYCLNAPDFYTKWLIDFNLDQTPTGEYPHVSPTPTPGYAPEPAAAWTDAAILVPWQMYRKYGDKRILEKYFDQMDKYIQACVRYTKGTYILEQRHYGDWLNIDADTPKAFLGTAYLAGMSALLSKIGGIIGREQDAKRLKNISKKVRNAFQKKYLDAQNGLTIKTQCAYLVALHFDLLPEKWISDTVDALVKDIQDTRNLHLSTGFIGTPFLLPVLSKFGHIELAYNLLLQTSYPSWLYPVTQGATTMWERWNSYTNKDGFGNVEMNSFNHYAYGAVAEWFFETIAGIKPVEDAADAVAFKRFRLAPEPGNRLSSATATFQSPYGGIASQWNRFTEDGKSFLIWNFAVPANTTAEITLPAQTILDRICPVEFQHDAAGKLIALPGIYSLLFEL